MSNGLTKVVLFFVGIFVAVAVAFFTHSSSNALARTNKNSVNKDPKANLFEQRASLSSNAAIQTDTHAAVESAQRSDHVITMNRFRELEKLSPEERQSGLVQAVKDGSAATLPQINVRVISLLPEYRAQILPILERESLQTMLSRFRQVDWLNWPFSSIALDGGPTEARSYIDLMHGENPEIGRFLETSAQLFYLLFRGTREGKVFSADAELENFLKNSEHGSDGSLRSAVPPRKLLDSQILHNPAFVPVLEEMRAQFVLRTVEKRSDDMLESFGLLLSVTPGSHRQEISSAIHLLTLQFSLEASPKYRAQVFDVLSSSKNLSEWLRQQPELQRPIAELYLVGAMDALDADDLRRAALFLDESQSLSPGLKSQDVLAEYLKSATGKPQTAAAAAAKPEESVKSTSDKLIDLVGNDSDSKLLLNAHTTSPEAQSKARSALMRGISYLSMFLFLMLVAGGVVLLVLYRRSISLTPGVSSTRAGKRSGSIRMTAPNDMDFGEDSESSKARQNAA